MGGAKGLQIAWLFATIYLLEIDRLFCHVFFFHHTVNENAQLRN